MRLKITAVVLSAALLTITISAAESFKKVQSISPGIDILLSKTVMTKSNVTGSSIRLTLDDFDRYLGKNQYSAIKIKKLPDKNVGILLLAGKEVKEGEEIQKEKINQLSLFPMAKNEESCFFLFETQEKEQIFRYTLSYQNKQDQEVYARHLEYHTYRNVSIKGKIPLSEGEAIEIQKNCREGIINFHSNSGEFTYSPKQNFYGTDCFYYKIFDQAGNCSETKACLIHVQKAENNLYFYDLKDDPNHYFAIKLCEEDIFTYREDEMGLPVFSPKEILHKEELAKILNAKTNYNSVDLQTGILLLEDERITKEQCLTFLAEKLYSNSSENN